MARKRQTNRIFISLGSEAHWLIMDHVPQVKGLRVIQVLEEVRRHEDIESYMPDLNFDKLPHRDFVTNFGWLNRNP